MVDAGRILIMPKGIWSSLIAYEMLDLVTLDGVAYLARQASVGQNPKLDDTYTYWQPFGSAMTPDGTTIIIDANNKLEVALDNRTLKYDSTNEYIKVSIDGSTIKYDNQNGYLYADLTAGLNDLTDVTIASVVNGQVLTYDSTTQKWKNATIPTPTASNVDYSNTSSGLSATKVQGAIDEVVTNINNKHVVSTFAVNTTGWVADTTSQSGVTLYKKSVSLSHVYDNPSVDIGCASGNVLPTTAEQTAYDLVQYVTVDDTVPCLYLYASDTPVDTFYINVGGVD